MHQAIFGTDPLLAYSVLTLLAVLAFVYTLGFVIDRLEDRRVRQQRRHHARLLGRSYDG